jgi:4-amino-4-deoxy-L-arabinose transferase-like glycosyltransferase
MLINQSSYTVAQANTKRYFYWFILIHLLAWTIGPLLLRGSLPHDTLEGIAWGLQWQWGYNKHPFFTAWACAGITKIFGSVDWPIYLLAQLAVATTFFAVWRLANKILPALQALVATLCLEGVLFYNLNSFNLTPDSMQSPIWALLTLCFYQALTTQAIRYWLLTGAFAALAVATKYQVALLFLPMLLLCVTNLQARRSFAKPGIYLALGLMLFLLIPHLIWLSQHQFITITYAFATPAEYTHQHYQWSHVIYPLRYLANNIGNNAGLIIMLWPFYFNRQKSTKNSNLSLFNWQFLVWLGLGPFIISVLLCTVTGTHFPPRWSTPYYFLIGILMLAWLQPEITNKKFQQFMVSLVVVGSLIFVARMGSIALGPKWDGDMRSDSYLPNQQIAQTLTTLWHEHYHQPLRYIAGSHYLVAALAVYSPDHPTPYFDWKLQESPWVYEDDLIKQGALVVWDEDANYTWDADSAANTHLAPNIRQRFPQLTVLGIYHFKRLTQVFAPVNIGVALLPPESSN